ncbi:MAG: MFS transporter [Candidatus Caldarchaeum sp.]
MIVSRAWATALSAAFILVLFQGFLYSYGVFMNYLVGEFGWSRGSASLPMSLVVLGGGLSGIVFGRLVDRHRANHVIAFSALLTSLGLMLLSTVDSLQSLYFLYLVVALGSGGVSLSVMSAIVSKSFSKKTGIALGVSTTGFALGALIMVPLTSELARMIGWRHTYIVNGASLALITVPLALKALSPSWRSHSPSHGDVRPAVMKLHKQFTLLSLTYFICGFTVTMISTHLAIYTVSVCDSTTVASTALALSIGGSVLSVVFVGALSEKAAMNKLLGMVYLARGISMVYLLYARDAASIILFAAVFGITNLATVPLTAGLASEIFGKASIGLVFATITFIHHLGGSVGAFFGGFVFDLTLSYSWAFAAGALLCLVASLLSVLINPKALSVEASP